ncbi:cell division protein FtsQ/DivIB [bacterium endosymbiont of Pedicinus badii]|uniref:cell division protein FtsQ/DivIB n=1 Tax=bacterium endosymbiont of Pedicinus badii TaxID=1719126 RepID=UPI0009BC5A6E|nr:cell division protein FtsQ/DivIB [bacterium endosymbiont of Pedicinus badii]OQM34222.1 hypothetical protein AOQ89_02720 [bacterium endosymbiont of Pedicinus badii]
MILRNTLLFCIFCVYLFLVSFCLIKIIRYNNSLNTFHFITNEQFLYTKTNLITSILSSLEMKNNFLQENFSSLLKEVKKISWIKNIQIQKEWPKTIKIRIVEYIPIALWNNTFCIDKDGNLFQMPNQYLNQIPKIFGPFGKEREILKNFFSFENTIKSINLSINTIIVNIENSYILKTKENLIIKIGKINHIDRIHRLVIAFPVILKYSQKNRKNIKYIDLRYKNGLAVKFE